MPRMSQPVGPMPRVVPGALVRDEFADLHKSCNTRASYCEHGRQMVDRPAEGGAGALARLWLF